MPFIYMTIKKNEDSLTCGSDETDSMRYHLRANKIDFSSKVVLPLFWGGKNLLPIRPREMIITQQDR
jgi:hypothetical protein